MCDTWIAMRDATQTQQVIFAKNSDRPIFDCQPLLYRPRAVGSGQETLQLEYVQLAQAAETYAHLGSSPYWCWGYEEGLNEHGVAIGNEALFTKPYRDAADAYRQGTRVEPGLLGMDLVRLGLERSRTSRQAVELIGRLVEQYGQFGSGVPGKDHPSGGYDNSFIIADPHEAWVLEAVGRRWAAKRVHQGSTSISNQPSIHTAWDMGSADITANAIAQGWWPAEQRDRFDFARAYSDQHVARQLSHIRMMRSRQLLAEQHGRVSVAWMMRIARDHYEGTFLQGPYFDAADPDFLSLCMHVSPAGFTWGNTASSCVAVLPGDGAELPIFWWTPGAPCVGCYVPFFVDGSELPAIVSRAGTFGKRVTAPHLATEDTFAPNSYWWQFRRLLDTVKGDPIGSRPGCYDERQQIVRAKFDALEASFAEQAVQVVRQASALREQDKLAAAHVLDDFSATCVQRVSTTVAELLELLNPSQEAARLG